MVEELRYIIEARTAGASNEQKCAVCSLRHGELLDAAHIIGDGKPDGIPIVPNGLSLCKIHHAAYDTNLLGACRIT
jgi:predicted restriction endonuclease